MITLFLLLILTDQPEDTQVYATYKTEQACLDEQAYQFSSGLQTYCQPLTIPAKPKKLVGPVQ